MVLWEAVVTALVAGFAPWTLLIVARLLRRERPMRHALAFLASAAAVSLLVGLVVVEAIGTSGVQDGRRHRSLSPAIDLGLGLAILVCVPWLVRRARRGPRTEGAETAEGAAGTERTEGAKRAAPKPRNGHEGGGRLGWWRAWRAWPMWTRWRGREGAGLVTAVVLGAYAGSPSPLYLASLHSITKGRPDSAVGVFEVLLIAVLFLVMAEVPIVLFAWAPVRTARLLESVNAWLGRHGRVLVAVGALAAGVYFTVDGLVHLS